MNIRGHTVIVVILICFFLSACTTPENNQITQIKETSAPTMASERDPDSQAIELAQGKPADVDGTLAMGEWDDAETFLMSDGSRLYLKISGDSLLLAVDAVQPVIVNVGIIRENELQILHSSAAVGLAVYQPDDSGWVMVKNFDWCCRVSAPDSQSADLLLEEKWLSHNQYVGDENQTEYQIVVPRGEIRIAVTILYRDQSGVGFWPIDLAEKDLLQFSTPPALGNPAAFSPDGWTRLIIED